MSQDQAGDARRLSSSKLSVLRKHPIFTDLEPEALDQLCRYAKHTSVKRGATIFSKDDPGNSLLAIVSGTVKISISSSEGRNAILNLIGAGELVGEIAVLAGQGRTADATANTDCEIFVIDRRDFLPFVRSQPALAMKFIELLCARLRRTSEQVQDITFLNLPTRLAKTLLQLTAVEDGSATRRKAAVTQREISQMIGISRESTNKQLRAWAKRGWIRLERGGVNVVAPDKLAAIAIEGSEFDRS